MFDIESLNAAKVNSLKNRYAFILGGVVVNIVIFDNPSDELLNEFKIAHSIDDILPITEFAEIGGTWDGTKFWRRKPYESWVKDEESNTWVPPVPYPVCEVIHEWDEATLSWKEAPVESL